MAKAYQSYTSKTLKAKNKNAKYKISFSKFSYRKTVNSKSKISYIYSKQISSKSNLNYKD